MAKHPTARRVRREQSDEDVFVAGVLESGAWAKKHSRLITIAGISVVIAAALLLYFRNYRANLTDKAATDLTAVRQVVLQGNRPLAIRELKTYITKYGKTASGEEARLLLAQIYVEDGQPASAVEVIKPVAGDPGEPGGASAALLLGAAYESANQLAQAEQTYIDIADEARFGFEKREALERAAAIRIQRGNQAGAVELYERAMNTFPEDSPERSVYRMRLAELQAGQRTGT